MDFLSLKGMNMDCISYKSGYKYQLKSEYNGIIGILPDVAIDTEYISLSQTGEVRLKSGYAWDGPSGPTIDTLNFMRGSLIHDALYQLMRERHLDRGSYREPADRLLQSICRNDGMSSLRAWVVYLGVRFAGEPFADPASDKPVIRAPKSCQ